MTYPPVEVQGTLPSEEEINRLLRSLHPIELMGCCLDQSSEKLCHLNSNLIQYLKAGKRFSITFNVTIEN